MATAGIVNVRFRWNAGGTLWHTGRRAEVPW